MRSRLSSIVRTSRATRARWIFVLLGSALLCSCSGMNVRTEGDPNFRVRPGDSYAWWEFDSDEDLRGPREAFARAIEGELAKRGLKKVDEDDAIWLLSARMEVEEKTRWGDPYFASFSGYRYEEGTLTVGIRDSETLDLAWSGQVRRELRVSARTRTTYAGEYWGDTGEERDWQVTRAVDRIFDELRVRR